MARVPSDCLSQRRYICIPYQIIAMIPCHYRAPIFPLSTADEYFPFVLEEALFLALFLQRFFFRFFSFLSDFPILTFFRCCLDFCAIIFRWFSRTFFLFFPWAFICTYLTSISFDKFDIAPPVSAHIRITHAKLREPQLFAEHLPQAQHSTISRAQSSKAPTTCRSERDNAQPQTGLQRVSMYVLCRRASTAMCFLKKETIKARLFIVEVRA